MNDEIQADFAPQKGMSPAETEALIECVLQEATLEEKVGMMSGRGFFQQMAESGGIWCGAPYRAGGGLERLGIAPFYFTDGPRGVARGNSTCFPCSMARGATFDTDLERRIGEIMGIETRAQDCTLSGAVCINLLRHPAWGRAQETYGEDPHHLGAMGAALGTGIQTHNVCATIKHFALNSIENARFKVDVRIDERALHEVYLPHFKRAIDAGIASVMTAYNKMNGEYCGQNRHLLTDILRGEWDFDGFTHSDWVLGVYQPYGAAAGLDVENPEPLVFGEKLKAAVEAGHIEPQVIDQACRRILRVYYRLAAAEDPLENYEESFVACQAHRDVALEAAEKSAVLLTNDGALPLERTKVKKLAVLGRLAAMENTGDEGSSRVSPPEIITALQGLENYLDPESVIFADEQDLDVARKAVEQVDAVIVVAGYTAEEEGEFIPGDISLGNIEIPEGAASEAQARPTGGDRASLTLPSDQLALIEAASATGKPLIVVIVAGSAVLIEEWHEKANAILQTFYSGMAGGTALARLLFGDVSPSGKLPFTVAREADDYPFFDRDAETIEYGYYHGYTKFDRDQLTPRFAFGHGLSYSSFSYRALRARVTDDAVEASVAVRNEGKRPADEVVQFYVGPPGKDAERPNKLLKAFARISLAPRGTKIVRAEIPLDDLKWRDPVLHDWRLERGSYTIMAGGASDALIEVDVDV